MLRLLDTMKISTRTYAGFGLVLALTLILGLYSILTLDTVRTQFATNQGYTEDIVAAANLEIAILASQVQVREYTADPIETNYDAVVQGKERLDGYIEAAEAAIQNPERVKALNTAITEKDVFFETVEQLRTQFNAREKAFQEGMNAVGPQIGSVVADLSTTAFKADSTSVYELANNIRNTYIKMRVSALRYIGSAKETFKDDFYSHYESLGDIIQQASARTWSVDIRPYLSRLETLTERYSEHFNTVYVSTEAGIKL